MTFTHALSTNNYGCAKFIVDGSSAANGTHTTIASALTSSSSGDTIFIRPGTYTENLTLKAGVNLCAYDCDASFNATGHVIISGTCTFTAAGSVSMSGIQLQTNSAALLAVTGSAASIVNINNCYLNMTNNTGITFSTSGVGSQIQISNCRGNLGTTGIAIFSHSSVGNLSFTNTIVGNSGGSSTASTCSAGSLTLLDGAFFANPITMSGTGAITAKFSEIDSNATNSTALTTVSGTTNDLEFLRLSSGSATPFSCGGTVTANGLVLHHTNATGITGAGTLLYCGAGILQDSTVGTISVTTLTPKFVLGALNSTAPPVGYIGEIITGSDNSAGSVTINTITNCTSVTLSPGTWEVTGNVQVTYNTGIGITNVQGALATANNNFTPIDSNPGMSVGQIPSTQAATTVIVFIGPARVNPSTSTSYFINCFIAGTSATTTHKGFMKAVRVA